MLLHVEVTYWGLPNQQRKTFGESFDVITHLTYYMHPTHREANSPVSFLMSLVLFAKVKYEILEKKVISFYVHTYTFSRVSLLS
jgi:hypothetical protein